MLRILLLYDEICEGYDLFYRLQKQDYVYAVEKTIPNLLHKGGDTVRYLIVINENLTICRKLWIHDYQDTIKNASSMLLAVYWKYLKNEWT